MLKTEKIEEFRKNYLLDNIDNSWKSFFNYINWKKIYNIIEVIVKNKFLPEKEDVFRIFRELSLEKIKVVILGQDPYHQEKVADGFAFSTRSHRTPASLQNIFTELKNDLGIVRNSNDLISWVKQGVFLLNCYLTVELNKPLSHSEEWKWFSQKLINHIKENKDDIIWVFWGNNAKSFKILCNIKSNYVIESTHPSPYSAKFGFFNSKPFSKIFNFLKVLKKEGINWAD